MVAIVGFGVESAIRVAGRYDDGNYVDHYAQIADEEYGYLTTSIRKLLK